MAAPALVLVLLAFPALVFGQCGKSRVFTEGRIIDGTDVIDCSVPWHVHVHFPPDNTADPATYLNSLEFLTCGAVLLDENHVMISPTCLFLYSQNLAEAMSRMVLVAGDNDASVYPEIETGVREQVRVPGQIFLNQNYPYRTQQDLFNNIDPTINDFQAFRDNQCAIVRVTTPFNLNACVKNICLPEPTDTACTFEGCVFSGNGLITSNVSAAVTRSNRLQMIKMTAVPTVAKDVLIQMGKFLSSDPTFAAVPQAAGTPCADDNGGALACFRDGSWFLRGTGILAACTSDLAPVFTDVPRCLDFVNGVLAGTTAATFP